MSSELEDQEYTQKLLDRTRARHEKLQQKMQEHSFQTRKRRPLEHKENLVGDALHQISNSLPAECISENESPSKRTRVDIQSSLVGLTDASTNPKSKSATCEKSVSERMQKLLNQRKQWEAADQGQEVDFSVIPSPISHDPKSPASNICHSRKVDVERRARLAAFAAEVNSREDELTRSNSSSSNQEEILPWKPPSTSGCKPPVRETSKERILSNPKVSGANTVVEPRSHQGKTISKRVSLSIETLSKFACQDKQHANDSLNNQAKKNVTSTFASGSIESSDSMSQEKTSHQVAPTKSLHERLIELQKNGCKAKQTIGTDSAAVERQKEREQSHDDSDVLVDQKNEVTEDITEGSCMAVASLIGEESNNASFTQEDMLVTPSEKSDTSSIESNADESGLSFNDSMMDDLEGAQVEEDSTFSVEDEQIRQESFTCSVSSESKDTEESRMIDSLFDGVEFSKDDMFSGSSIVSEAAMLGAPSLTRQKSRLEIQSQLTVHKQTCHEAEDTHAIKRNPSRRLRPLARSTSTESVVSLGNEKPNAEPTFQLFTIDAYRTEKRKSLRKVDKKIVRKEDVKSLPNGSDIKSRMASLKEKNSKLLEEVQQQQRVIQQASAALNCCYDVHHGKGSITELEAEKLLLIATEKRLALLAEIQRLKAPSPDEESKAIQPCHGVLTIGNIQLPLRTEYIFSMASKKDGAEIRSHYYFILVRCGSSKILATHLASTHDSLSADSLVFKDAFEFDSLESDFEIVIEVYSVSHRSRADGVPNQEKSKRKITGLLQKSLTPRKHKARSMYGSLSHTASPGGPNAIRISSFALIGSTTVRLGDVNKRKFVLQKVPFLSPISGHLGCRIIANFKSNAEQRGFLTMFDDVGGLGAWHRRWCALMHGVLYSWTYPDDEKHKNPLSTLKVSECISKDISTVERIMCARPNTFEIRTMRPRRDGDKQNLISQDTGTVITTKHWLAADTKEERVAWINALNQALADVRAWDISALKPLA